MTYEEKRELRLQISQLLADAGLNQEVIKDIVEEEIKNKVDRAIDQVIKNLNSETSNGDYIKTQINRVLNDTYIARHKIDEAIKEELKNRVIKVALENVEND